MLVVIKYEYFRGQFYDSILLGLEFDDTEMDKEFLLELRELKVLLDREKDHKQ